MKTIEEQILLHATLSPNKIALIWGDEEITYQQLWINCLKNASILTEKYHLKKGDRVILAASASPKFVYAYFGTHIAGGISVPIDPDTNQTRFEYISKSINPICVFGELCNVKDKVDPFFELDDSTSVMDYGVPASSQIADILFTTGTTGSPKGVSLSYSNLSAAAQNINTFIGNTKDDIELLALPISHSFGLGRLRCSLSMGSTIVLLGTFANVKRFFGELKHRGVTMFAMVPASWNFIKKMSGEYIKNFSDQLKFIEIGSSFMPIEEKKHLISLLPNTRICMHYGSTEASRSAFMEFHSSKDNLSTIGQASPNCQIQIFSPSGEIVPYGCEGEICVKGAHVTCAYWNEDSKRFLLDFYGDFFRTGDCGVMDEEGNVYLKSRIKEIINVGGKKVAPMEIEDVLNTLHGVKDSACVGIPDPANMLGEVVKAFVVADDSITNDDIISYLRTRIEVYKLPVAIERVPDIPRTSSGKIQRLLLKRQSQV